MHFLDVNLEDRKWRVECHLQTNRVAWLHHTFLTSRQWERKKTQFFHLQKQSYYTDQREIFPSGFFHDTSMASRLCPNCIFFDRSYWYMPTCIQAQRSVNLFSRLEHIQCDKYNERRRRFFFYHSFSHTHLKGRRRRNEWIVECTRACCLSLIVTLRCRLNVNKCSYWHR